MPLHVTHCENRKCDVSNLKFQSLTLDACRSRWPRGLKRGSTHTHLLGLRVRVPLGAWVPVSCKRVVSQRSLRRTDHSSRRDLPSVACLCVIGECHRAA